jgi:hypothetical protein
MEVLMRFSLKWLLAAAVYVALAAAAFSQTSWVYADLLWAASQLALVYAGLMALTAPPRTRIAAMGFLMASLCFLIYLTGMYLLGGSSTPMTRLLVAAGYEQYQPSPVMYSTWVAPPAAAQPSPSNPTYTLSVATPPVVAPTPLPATPIIDFAQYVRAANAVGMIVFGLLGTVMAAFVRRDETQQPSVQT